MPAIRDFTTNYTTDTTAATITIDTPDYQQNDLFLAVICADTDTSGYTWSSAGWSLLGERTSTSQLAVMYKIAGAGEAASFTFTRSHQETFNGGIISIRDINTTAPFGSGIATTGLASLAATASGTYTRAAGSFVTDGFAIGQTIMACGFATAGNNVTKVIQSVVALTITVTNNTGMANDGSAAGRNLTSAVGIMADSTAADRQTMDSITTTVNNSLIMYAISNSTQAGSPEFIEGPVDHLYTVQGTAESSGVGWGFQAGTGATPTVYSGTASSAAGARLTLEIAPPAGGATVIPSYNPSDNSHYVDPINGTTVFNTNSAFTGNSTTYFGNTINGIAEANGTAGAVADQGINPTNSTGQITTSAANNWSGATLVLGAGNYTDVTGKNILCHTGPTTRADYQRFKAAVIGRGVAFGMASATDNTHFTIWHVFGARTAFGANRDVPIIINSSNTTGVLQTNNTLDPGSIKVFGFFLASQSATNRYEFYSIWVLDTLTIAGGNSAEPVDIPGISDTIQGHNHRGALIQGANQLLLMMPLQFGNGGTDPLYLDLNSTAIEFPELYNRSSKKVVYCSAENVAGIAYYAGAADTIKHRNSLISSASKYHWTFNASSSTSATYDFSGLFVIGAGTITLINNLPLSGISWSGCDNFASAGAYLDGCLIQATTSSTAALTVSSTTNLSRITNSVFNSNTVGPAIQLITAGTYTSDGNTFSSNTYDIVNTSNGTNLITMTDTRNTDVIIGNGTYSRIAESFTGDGNQLANVQFTLSRSAAAPSGSAYATIYATSGSVPTGSALTTSQALDVSTLTTSPVVTTLYFIGTNNITLTNAVTYAVALEYTGGDGTHYVNVGIDTTSPTYGGTYSRYTSSWASAASTTAITQVRTGGIVIVNAVSGSNPSQSKVLNTGSPPGSTTINVTVNLEVNGVVQNSQCWIYAGGTALMNAPATTQVSGNNYKATNTYSYTGDTAVTVRAREMGYLPYESSGTITSGGLTVTAVWQVDPNWQYLVTGETVQFTNPTTITRGTGNFTTDGWLSIMGQVDVSGSQSNDGTYTIAAVGTTTITISGATLTNEGPSSGITLTFTRISLT